MPPPFILATLLLLTILLTTTPAHPGENTPPPQPQFKLTQNEINQINTLAPEAADPEVKTRFEHLYNDWRQDWKNPHANTPAVAQLWNADSGGVKPPYSSDQYDYVKTKPYHELRKLGPGAVPLLLPKMLCEPKPYHVVRLYLQMQKNPWLNETELYLSNTTSKAHALAKRWLDNETRRQHTLLPLDRKRLEKLCAQIPEPVRKEFAWRFHNWRQCRAEELRQDKRYGPSTCDAPLIAMGRQIAPLLLERIASVPAGWFALPILEKFHPLPPPLPNEHPQAHADRIAKTWLVETLGPTKSTAAERLAEDFEYLPVAPQDAQTLAGLTNAIPENVRERFDHVYLIWQLFRDPNAPAKFNWDEILTGGPEVEELATLGDDALVLLAKEMAEDPVADLALPLYKAVQKNRALLPRPPAAGGGSRHARIAATMWLETHRPDSDYVPGKFDLGGRLGVQPYLPKGSAEKLLELLAVVPDEERREFDALYQTWRLLLWNPPPAVGGGKTLISPKSVVARFQNFGPNAIPLLMERAAFRPDGVYAEQLLHQLQPAIAYRHNSKDPWLPTRLAMVENWLREK